MDSEKNTSLITLGAVAIIGVVGLFLMLSGTTGFVAGSAKRGTTYKVELTPEAKCAQFKNPDGLEYVPAYQNGQPVINNAMNLVKCVPLGPGRRHEGANRKAYDDKLAIWAALETTGYGGAGGTRYETPSW